MTSGRYGLVLREVGRLLKGGTVAAMGEGQLLERFAADRDPAAFEALVTRHGPMVLRTCRRMLSDPHDVDDAFQATFLVLARRAGSIRDADRLGPWLHGVARRVAGRSRALSARRRSRERPGAEDRAVEPENALEATEHRELLDEELARLPEKYRAPLVLCYLEGLTHDEAAEALRWPVGTVRSRLAGGRDRLRARLTRRGLSPSAAVPALAPASAIPEALLSATIRVATSAGSAPARVAILAKGALVAMMWSKAKTIAAVGLMAGLAVGGASVAAQKAGDGQDVAPEQPPTARELTERVGGLRRDLDAANLRIGKLEKLVAEQRDMIRAQQDRPAFPEKPAEPGTSAVDRPGMKPNPGGAVASRPEVVLGGIGGGSSPEAPPGAAEPRPPVPRQAMVMTLPGNPDVFAVISGERDRITMIDPITQDRRTFRLGGPATSIFPLGGALVGLNIQGPAVKRVAVYDRRNKRWYEHDLKESATQVVISSGQSMVASGNEAYALLILAPEVSQLAVFDLGEKKWVTQDLREPARGGVSARVSPSTASYLVGRFVYTYSALAKKWTILELKAAASATPRPEGGPPGLPGVDVAGKMVLPEGDIIHIYDARTGDWTHIDTKDEK